MVKDTKTEGLYLYCITEGETDSVTGMIGVADNDVFTIQLDDLSLVVHECSAEAYRSDEKEKVEQWILRHQNVIDAICKQANAVLPIGFNTIIKSDEENGLNAEENLKQWLKKDHERLKEKLGKVRDKDEYGVQVLWDPKVIIEKIGESVPEIQSLKEELQTKSAGTAYMLEQRLKGLIKSEFEKMADESFKEFYGKIRPVVDDLKVDKTKKLDEDMQMLMNLSCLVRRGKVKELGDLLEIIQEREGYAVRFTGPWPAYSFV